MTQRLTEIPRPHADRYEGRKNLFLVPNYMVAPGIPDEVQQLIERYWSDVRDSIANLERSLGAVTKIYHEMICEEDDAGLAQIETLNPSACTLVRAMCQSTASVRSLEDAELLAEHSDWHRILTMGPTSQKVLTSALEGYQQTLSRRYEGIAERIADDLSEGEPAVLFIREDHRVQFGSEVQVFYVAPPSLDALKRWLDDFFRSPPPSQPEQEDRE